MSYLDIIESFWSLVQNNTATGQIYIYCVWLRLKLWRRPKPDQISRIWQGSDWPHCDQADPAAIEFGLSFFLISALFTSMSHFDHLCQSKRSDKSTFSLKHHAENCPIHRKMVDECPLMTPNELSQTQQDQERGMIGPASILHSWHWVLLQNTFYFRYFRRTWVIEQDNQFILWFGIIHVMFLTTQSSFLSFLPKSLWSLQSALKPEEPRVRAKAPKIHQP